jgi:hypothetical protein
VTDIFCQFFSSSDEYGFARPENFDSEAHETFMCAYLPVLVRRGQRWEQTYKKGEDKNYRLKRFVRKGIPSR